MPHVIVKMYEGRKDAEKKALGDAITKSVQQTLGYGPDAVSVSVEDVAPKDWAEKVFKSHDEHSPASRSRQVSNRREKSWTT